MLALPAPRLPLPANCGVVLRRISRMSVLLPEPSIAFESTEMTGMATELAAGARYEPVTSNFSSLTTLLSVEAAFSAGAFCAKTKLAANSGSRAQRAVMPRQEAVRCVFIRLVWMGAHANPHVLTRF